MRPKKDEVMAFLKMEPATEQELSGLKRLAPGDYEVYSERLNMMLDEAKEVFVNVGISPFVQGGDLALKIFYISFFQCLFLDNV